MASCGDQRKKLKKVFFMTLRASIWTSQAFVAFFGAVCSELAAR
jgi:hypothetical protein